MENNLRNTPGIETTHPNKKFRNRLKTTWRIHLELKQLTQQEVQKEVENNLENTPGIETTHPIRSSETG